MTAPGKDLAWETYELMVACPHTDTIRGRDAALIVIPFLAETRLALTGEPELVDENKVKELTKEYVGRVRRECYSDFSGIILWLIIRTVVWKIVEWWVRRTFTAEGRDNDATAE